MLEHPDPEAGADGAMELVDISRLDVDLDIVYATGRNFTGKPVYRRAAAYLHPDAADRLARAVALAARHGNRILVYDAFRPSEAQWKLWEHTPDPDFLADPRRGSPHSRGVAVDLTLLDGDGKPLEMGTGFDHFSPLSHHGNTDISKQAERNRFFLLGLMTTAGWDFYRNEWWHYQLFDSRRYALLGDDALDEKMM